MARTVEDVMAWLDQLADFEAQVEQLEEQRKDKSAALLTPELISAIAAVDMEYLRLVQPIQELINEVQAAIREVVADLGQTVKGSARMATYTGPKPEVDMNKLMGYAAAHPDLNALITMKKPVVTIRRLK